MGGISSIHDRACELYQQIIGITRVQQSANKSGIGLTEQIYGKDHVAKNHRSSFYKPRFLRKKDSGADTVTAHPKGISDWSETNKIHFIGHSLGAQTIRYLQYLLKIGYFDDEYKGVDRSNWIASISCLSAPLNGTPVIESLGFCQKQHKFTRETWLIKALKYFVISRNLLSSSGTDMKTGEKVIKKCVSLSHV